MRRVSHLVRRWSLVAATMILVGVGCGSPPPLTSDPLTTDELTAACASCEARTEGLNGETGSISLQCATHLPPLNNLALRCLARANGKAQAVQACLGITRTKEPVCNEGGVGASCDGSRTVLWCDDTGTTTGDCAQRLAMGALDGTRGLTGAGPRCVTGSTCGFGTCGTSDTACEGDFVTECSVPVRVATIDCGAKGMTCAVVDASATCIGTGPACNVSDPAAARCEGNVAVNCAGGQEAREDCGAHLVEGTCVVDAGTANCVLGTDCDPQTASETCADDKLTFCLAGRWRTASCHAFGYQYCTGSSSCGYYTD